MTITLKTLGSATEQQVFDQVVTHLAQQKRGAFLEGKGCAYRGDGGTKCAAGCLIADDEYTLDMDELDTPSSWSSLVERGFVPKDHKGLILALQNIHDGYFGEELMAGSSLEYALKRFYEITRRYNLDTKVLDALIEAL